MVRARTVALRRDVAEGIRLQAQADRAVDSLRADQRRLGQQRLLLTQLEAQHRTRAQGLTDSAMLEEDRATALGEDARDIVNLMGQASERAAIARQLASLPGPVPRPPIPGHPASTIPDPATLIANRLSYRLPVVGRLMIGLGEVSQAGVRARGLTIAPQPGTRVMAPAGGRIVYAGPFRDYGRIVIIDHGSGLTSLIARLASLAVKAGDSVSPATPIGRAGTAKPEITVELRRGNQPIDIARLIAAG
jgi:septal ring factor EnvC (AmiA/AmiB activator)